jgi:predicted transcriptional regulator
MAAEVTDHQGRRWKSLTNHARVLAAIARDPDARLTQVAAACQISERSAQRIVADLEEAGYLRRQRVDRRTQYIVNRDGPFQHPAEADLSIGALLELMAGQRSGTRTPTPRSERNARHDGTNQ